MAGIVVVSGRGVAAAAAVSGSLVTVMLED